MTQDAAPTTDLVSLTVDLVTAYVAHNAVRADVLPSLIASIHRALADLGKVAAAATTEQEPVATPAVTVRKSLASRDHILSLIDGKPYKALRRHLSAHGLTPDAYRARYDLPASYPMVAPAYSEHRSALAKALGLGRQPRAAAPVAATEKLTKASPRPRTKTAKS